ncbi:hypothetical protein [Paraflavitalea speifideaquila]|uniref:hypothetical protein n=1 Tax=Paraflavitalea speifideaquila TaxID=3076558 RepID=UPI0028EE90EB|nr:hypothetical protein [Paraflavitalea speifideiaquila]
MKKAFEEVNGFEGIDNIPSGDDMLLMHKIYRKYPDKVFYLKSKEAIVSTGPAASWKAFFTNASVGPVRQIVMMISAFF